MKFINEDGSVYNAKPLFSEQIKARNIDTQYEAGVVCKNGDKFIVGYEMRGAEETFSIGQPVYDKDGNIMGWLGIGLFSNLNYSTREVRIPCEYWQICFPTDHCEAGKKIYTFWQNKERKGTE